MDSTAHTYHPPDDLTTPVAGMQYHEHTREMLSSTDAYSAVELRRLAERTTLPVFRVPTWRDALECIEDDVEDLLQCKLFAVSERRWNYIKTWCLLVADEVEWLEAELGCHFDETAPVKVLLYLRKSYQQVSHQHTGNPRSPPIYTMMVSSHFQTVVNLFNGTLTRTTCSEEILPLCGCCRDQDDARTGARSYASAAPLLRH